MSYSRINEVFSVVGNGVTEPLRCILEDGTHVVYKTVGNPEGSRVLINEWIGYQLAVLLNLPMPDAGLAHLDASCKISDEMRTQVCGEWDSHFGLGFYTHYKEKTTQLTSPSLLSIVTNRLDIPRIVLFDLLICNNDRNPGNLLIEMRKGNCRLHIIDHTHIFCIGPMWDGHQLRIRLSDKIDVEEFVKLNEYNYSMFYENYKFDREEFELIIKEFQITLSPTCLQDIIESVPEVWSLSAEDKSGLQEYLLARLNALPTLIDSLLKGGC